MFFRSWRRRFSTTVRGWREEILGPCNNPCAKCDDRFHCINKKAWLSPVPLLAWGGLALATAIPLYMSLNPRAFIGAISGASDKLELMDAEDVELVWGPVMRRVGLKHPDRVMVAITDGIGPTCTGMDGPRGGVILFPFELFVLLNPATDVSFDGIYEGPVGKMPETARARLLDDGFLVPTPSQIEFIFGHEVAHLKHQHTYETSKIALLTALMTHAGLELNNLVAHRSANFGFMEIRRAPTYVSLVLAVTALVVAAVSWDQELEADATSARQLGFENEAVSLKQHQLHQSRVSGVDNHVDLEHPPPSLQLLNLEWLRESILKEMTETQNKAKN